MTRQVSEPDCPVCGTPPATVAVPLATLREAVEAIEHDQMCGSCAEDSCSACQDCTSNAALASLRSLIPATKEGE